MTTSLNNLSVLNAMTEIQAREALFRCSGSSLWTEQMLAARPFADAHHWESTAEAAWQRLSRQDWLQAFRIHPKIGDLENLRRKFASTASWAAHEQAGASQASEEVICELALGNSRYENKFGYIFIVCATGKSAAEMLAILKSRLPNDEESEFALACQEQKKITNLRLTKLEL